MGQGHGVKGGLISEVILALVSLATKGAKILTWVENLKKLFTKKDRKFKLPAQESYFELFVGNGTELKIPSEIKPPLGVSTTM